MLRKRQLIIDYQNLFRSPEGERVLQDLRKLCVAFDSPITSTDPITLAIKTGEANVIKHIYKRMKQDPNAVSAQQSKAININSNTGE